MEARILRRADADHVVGVYDNGETESRTPYFVMSYADRDTVADLIAQGRPSVEESLDVIRQAGAGLAVLHSHGATLAGHRVVPAGTRRDAGGRD